jgi:hypothetical protein
MNPFYSFLGFSNIKNGQTRAHGSLYVFRVGVNCISYYIYEKINIKYTVNLKKGLHMRCCLHFHEHCDFPKHFDKLFFEVTPRFLRRPPY